MSQVTLRSLLSKLTALALAASPTMANTAIAGDGSFDVCDPDPDLDSDLDLDQVIGPEHVPLVEPSGLADRDRSDAIAALGRSLALVLPSMRPLTATQLASTWAASLQPVHRLAVARALESQFHLVGDDIVIDHLSRDADPEIRIAAARAAVARRSRGGDPGVIDRLAGDPDPRVRAVVARACHPR